MRTFMLVTIVISAIITVAGGIAAFFFETPEQAALKYFRQIDTFMAAERFETAEKELLDDYPEEAERSIDVWLRLGICRSMLGDFDAAEERFESGLKIDPQDPRLLFNQALLCERVGQSDEAERRLLRLNKIAPYFPQVLFQLGLLAEKRGDVERAKEYYIEELNQNPASHSAWKRHFELSEAQADSAAAPEEEIDQP